MGDHANNIGTDPAQRRLFAHALVKDLQAIDRMQREGLFESGVRRMGAEQEVCLVDGAFRPSPHGPEILATLQDPHFTSEIARYTLEINLDPFRLSGCCLTETENQLRRLLKILEKAAAGFGDRIVLAGILPTIGMRELESWNMTPAVRYQLLEQRISELRGGDVELSIQGIDDLMMRHDNILFEACNTSFQVHVQVDPEQFVDQYNWAQAISAFVLAPAANSPLLLGRELWDETRIALFQQSVDTRSRDAGLRQRQARVYFGNRWIRENLTEIFQEDIARYPLLFAVDADDSLQQLDAGEVPRLRALALHNGTIWKWNRPCFGSNGRIAHLRIENRYLPAGPTVADQMANAAFWLGLMTAMPEDYRQIWNRMDFRTAKENFLKVAQHGMNVELQWDGQCRDARSLILDIFLPLAAKGLESEGVETAEIAKYLGILEHRVVKRRTGAGWLRETFRQLDSETELVLRKAALTEAYWKRQQGSLPVAEWDIPALEPAVCKLTEERVDQLMSTNLITLRDDDAILLAAKIMQWNRIEHIPIENAEGLLVGMVCWNDLQRFAEKETEAAEEWEGRWGAERTCADLMVADPICVAPDSLLVDAKSLMLSENIGSLPVTVENRLIGLVTRKDILRLEGRSEFP